MTTPTVTQISVSVDLGDKVYGSGSSSFCSLQARYPEGGVALDEITDVVDSSMDLYLACWQTLTSGRYATGIIPAAEYKEVMRKVAIRIEQTRKFLREQDNRGQTV
jgi:hypothetical protein